MRLTAGQIHLTARVRSDGILALSLVITRRGVRFVLHFIKIV